MLRTSCAKDMLAPEDRLALMIAALCHDLDHDGYSNSYHGARRLGCLCILCLLGWLQHRTREVPRASGTNQNTSRFSAQPAVLLGSGCSRYPLVSLSPECCLCARVFLCRSQHPVGAGAHLQRRVGHGEPPLRDDLCAAATQGARLCADCRGMSLLARHSLQLCTTAVPLNG